MSETLGGGFEEEDYLSMSIESLKIIVENKEEEYYSFKENEFKKLQDTLEKIQIEVIEEKQRFFEQLAIYKKEDLINREVFEKKMTEIRKKNKKLNSIRNLQSKKKYELENDKLNAELDEESKRIEEYRNARKKKNDRLGEKFREKIEELKQEMVETKEKYLENVKVALVRLSKIRNILIDRLEKRKAKDEKDFEESEAWKELSTEHANEIEATFLDEDYEDYEVDDIYSQLDADDARTNILNPN